MNQLPKYQPQVFIDWLTRRMDKTGVRETARQVGLSHPTISDILGGEQPSEKTCVLLARFYNEPVEYVLHIGGHLNIRKIDGNIKKKTLMNEADDLTDDEIEEAIGYVRYKKEQAAKAKTRHPVRRVE